MVVWAILTDYDNLANIVPNLVQSRRLPNTDSIRIYQEGAQNIVGFDFRASLTMDMVELVEDRLRRPLPQWRLRFACHESAMFDEFNGEWSVRDIKPGRQCELTYVVDVTPKGASMARSKGVREDVPPNMAAIKRRPRAGKICNIDAKQTERSMARPANLEPERRG